MQHEQSAQPRATSDRFSILVGLTISLLLTTLMVLGTSRAAWTATTTSSGSSLSVGGLVLTDDDGGAALMNVSGLFPGDSASQCIEVTYDSTPDPVVIKVYSGALTDSDSLAQWVNVKIEEGSGGGYGACGGFVASSTIFDSDLATWGTKTSYASGVGLWDPTGGTESATYRFTVTLDLNAPSSVQNASVTGIEFKWETQA